MPVAAGEIRVPTLVFSNRIKYVVRTNWIRESRGPRVETMQALRRLEAAVRAAPDKLDALMELGRAQIENGKGREAYETWQRCAQLAPDRADVLEVLADLLHRQGDFPRALTLYQRILAKQPRHVAALTHAGILLMKMGHAEDGRDWLLKAATVREDPEVLFNLALAERAHGDFSAALAALDRLQEKQPGHYLGLLGKAQVLERMGEAKAAFETLESLIQQGHRRVGVLGAYARLAPKFGAAAKARDLLRVALPEAESDVHATQQLWFALGGVEDSLDNFDAAFAAYERANRSVRKPYDPAAVERTAEKIIGFFSAERLAGLPKAKNRSPRPVLIVGMPRSGTSLVEQILDCHPQVAGAGELNDLQRAAHTLSGAMDYPAGLASVGPALLEELAGGYSQTLRRVAGEDTELVTDKMPTNFEQLGLAAMLTPNARVVHCVRDARDVCLSAYFQNFRSGNVFAGELTNLGHFYRHYEKLMRHWHAVAPLPIIGVNYEALVREPEDAVRRLLGALDLPFDAACLQPERNKRYVNTASDAQVRRPIYTGSIGRWQRYASHLQPLEAALAERES